MDAVLMCGGEGSRLDPRRRSSAAEVDARGGNETSAEVDARGGDGNSAEVDARGGNGNSAEVDSETEGDTEKPLVPVDGVPMVERVRRALAESRIERVHAVVSPRAPETRAWAESTDCAVIEGAGAGYVADLDRALDEVGRPALTCAADLPLLSPEAVNRALDRAEGDSLAVCVPARLKRELGASADTSFERDGRTLAPSGLNVVGDGDDRVVVSWDARLAVNVNRPGDLELARRLVE